MQYTTVIHALKLKIWYLIYSPIYKWKYFRCRKERKYFCILDSVSSIRYIVENKCSVSRFGDGELAMIYHYLDGRTPSEFYIQSFQDYDVELAKRLYEVLLSNGKAKNHKVGLPYPICSVKEYIGLEKVFWERFVVLDIERFKNLLNTSTYVNSCFTRFYLHHKKKDLGSYISLLKQIWEGLDICIVEGYNSRLGVGNDLFDSASSISRILAPTVNAFSKYENILDIIKNKKKYDLYLLALGHTATVLAYDLSKLNLWAVDIGHVDIEYEWYRKGVKKKMPVSGKYVNEIPEGRVFLECMDPIYKHEIIARI